jgi:hypothetical protein
MRAHTHEMRTCEMRICYLWHYNDVSSLEARVHIHIHANLYMNVCVCARMRKCVCVCVCV